MTGRTFVTETDPQTADAVERLAAEGGRLQAEVAAEALRFYTRLPAVARAAMRNVEEQGTQPDLDALTRQIADQALYAEREIANRPSIVAMPSNDRLAIDEDSTAKAARLTR